MDVRERLEGMLEKSGGQEPRLSWADRFERNFETEEGYRAYLSVIAEHPSMSVRNVAAVVQHRLTYDTANTQELYTFEEAKGLGGYVRKGAKAIPITQARHEPAPDGTDRVGFETVFKFCASDCVNLDEGRYKGYPHKVNGQDAESVQLFMDATEKVDLSAITTPGPAAYAFDLRYGFDHDDTLPERPEYGSVEELVERCDEVRKALGRVCRDLDRAITLEIHPEWAEDCVQDGHVVTPAMEEAPKPVDTLEEDARSWARMYAATHKTADQPDVMEAARYVAQANAEHPLGTVEALSMLDIRQNEIRDRRIAELAESQARERFVDRGDPAPVAAADVKRMAKEAMARREPTSKALEVPERTQGARR